MGNSQKNYIFGWVKLFQKMSFFFELVNVPTVLYKELNLFSQWEGMDGFEKVYHTNFQFNI